MECADRTQGTPLSAAAAPPGHGARPISEFSFRNASYSSQGVTQALDVRENREVDVSEPASDQIAAAVVLQHALEIAQEFWHAVLPELPAATLRCRLLL